MGTDTIRFSTLDDESAQPQPRSLAQRLAQKGVIAMLCLSVTAPVIFISSSLPWFKVEQLLLPLAFAVYGWFLLAGFARQICFNGMFLVGALFSFCIVLSIWFGADLLRQTVILRDFYEIPKALLPVIFFTLTYEANLSEHSLRTLFRVFAGAVLFVCTYAWAQWMGLSIVYPLNRYYSGGEHIDGALRIYRRVYSTMGNANVLGELLTWSIVAYTLAALCGVGNRLKSISVAFACLIALAMTGSRYGLLNTSLGLILIFVILSLSNRQRFVQLSLLLLLLPIFGWTVTAVAMKNKATFDRIQTLKSPLDTDSLRQRLDDVWKDAYAEIFESPFLGHGPAKTRFSGIVTDSEYLDVLKQFGIVGFLPYSGYFLFPLCVMWRGVRSGQRAGPAFEERHPATFLALRLSFIMAVTAMVMNIGMSTFYNAMLQGFLWMWLGIGARCAKTVMDASMHPARGPFVGDRVAYFPAPFIPVRDLRAR